MHRLLWPCLDRLGLMHDVRLELIRPRHIFLFEDLLVLTPRLPPLNSRYIFVLNPALVTFFVHLTSWQLYGVKPNLINLKEYLLPGVKMTDACSLSAIDRLIYDTSIFTCSYQPGVPP